MPNPCAKTRSLDNPYEVWEAAGWKWLVLRKYQANDDKPYARWYCFVTSPMCPDGEYGDTYAAEVKASAVRTDNQPGTVHHIAPGVTVRVVGDDDPDWVAVMERRRREKEGQ